METKITGINHLWKVDSLYLTGQPTSDSVADIKALGIDRVFNLRGESEMDFSSQKSDFEAAGIEYHQLPILDANKSLNKESIDKLNSMMDSSKSNLIHCGTANRVGGWLITHLVQNKKMNFDEAVEIAKNNGLKNEAFIEQARQILSLIHI